MLTCLKMLREEWRVTEATVRAMPIAANHWPLGRCEKPANPGPQWLLHPHLLSEGMQSVVSTGGAIASTDENIRPPTCIHLPASTQSSTSHSITSSHLEPDGDMDSTAKDASEHLADDSTFCSSRTVAHTSTGFQPEHGQEAVLQLEDMHAQLRRAAMQWRRANRVFEVSAQLLPRARARLSRQCQTRFESLT